MELGLERRRLRVSGTVQGVGFRPFVHRLAHDLGVTGAIGNDDAGVWCEVQGATAVLDRFVHALATDAPPLARVDWIESERVDVEDGDAAFQIRVTERSTGAAVISIPPDVASCDRCLAEIDDVRDRRHRYAFTCCADCGPRFTVVRELPYDRERTSLADFPLCAACAAEYTAPGDRRHHAQATCCPACGPQLTLRSTDGATVDGDPIEAASALLEAGSILAVKGVGGFQLVCRADDEAVVGRLRTRKHRDEKPFALLVGSIGRARSLVELDTTSRRALEGPEAPIVLAPRSAGADVAASVAPGNRLLGVMLPATPLHALLARAVPFGLVCTSGNRSDEPIATDDDDAASRLDGIADATLTHDRRIERRADDSVGQSVHGRFQLLRRARGFAPRPVRLARGGPPVLGVGAELKSTVCLAVADDAHVSVHLGDLEHPRTIAAFEHAVADLLDLARVEPALVVHDLHPEYVSTKFAAAQGFGPTLAVQHHHAHLASCLTEHRFEGPAIGVTFDGLGWGADDTVWGGEFLVGDATVYRRAAHLAPVALPGLARAIREPWRMAVAHLVAAGVDPLPSAPVLERHAADVPDVAGLCASAIRTSSIGRLFDAVAALCDLADTVSYEGQAAIRLEQRATDTDRAYGWRVDDGDVIVAHAGPVVRAVVEDRDDGVDIGVIAGAFHRGVAEMIVDVCVELRARSGVGTVALTGGVFQNRRLAEAVITLLEPRGFAVLTHAQVPPNDGGISLGQIAVGRAQLRRG